MSFGSRAPAPPPAQPVVPAPQPDDPKGIEEQRRRAIAASNQGGTSAHLLSGENGVTDDPNTSQKQLKPY